MSVRPTAAQLAALRLAERNPDGIRYYRGGWYTIPEHGGDDQHAEIRGRAFGVASPQTLDACVRRGWLARSCGSLDVYRVRWILTHAGREVLENAEKIP